MPPKRPAKLSLAVGVSDDKPAVETAESRAAAAAEPVIGSDKFESHGLVVDKSGVYTGARRSMLACPRTLSFLVSVFVFD